MNRLERDEIERLADLAGLEIESSDLATLAREIASILDYVSQIEILMEEDTCRPQQGVESGTAVYLRSDDVDSTPSIADPKSFAPDFEDGFFVVPRVESIGEE